MQENYEIFKDLIQTVGLVYFISFIVCSGDIKKKKKSSVSVSVFIQRRACYGIKCAGERERVFNVPELVSRM